MGDFSFPLTVFGGMERLGLALWKELHEQTCRVCDSQRAAVPQHGPAGVRADCGVRAASLRPERREQKRWDGMRGKRDASFSGLKPGWCCPLTAQSGCVDMPAGR